jgi:hypothetical protein
MEQGENMRRLARLIWIGVCLVTLLWFDPGRSVAQLQDDPARVFLNLINEARMEEGLPPLASSTLLTKAAERHAEDMAENARIDQVGSDGSTYQQRIDEAGYRAWDNGLLVNESIWAGLGTAENAINWFLEQPDRWDMFVDPRYREIGVGYASDAQGVNYFVADFGSRPGVLPIFINDGAEVTESPQVAIRLTNEEAEPLGEGARIGKAIEIRVSNTPDFDGEAWEAWEPLIPWELAGTEPGDYAVYVQFRDGAGRTTISEDTIRLVTQGAAPTTAAPEPEATAVPEVTPLPTSTPGIDSAPTPTPALPPEESPTSVPTPRPTETPDAVPVTPLPTWTPLPTQENPELQKETDWSVLIAFVLQGVAILLGGALFLRRH